MQPRGRIDIQLARKWIFVKNTMVKLGDMSKGAACIKMAAAKLGLVEEIVLMRSLNFMRSTKLLLN